MGELRDLRELGPLWSSVSLELMISKMLYLDLWIYVQRRGGGGGWEAGKKKEEMTRNIKKENAVK